MSLSNFTHLNVPYFLWQLQPGTLKTSHKEIHDGKKYEMVIATPSGFEAISLQKMDTLTAVRRDDLNLSRDPLEKKIRNSNALVSAMAKSKNSLTCSPFL